MNDDKKIFLESVMEFGKELVIHCGHLALAMYEDKQKPKEKTVGERGEKSIYTDTEVDITKFIIDEIRNKRDDEIRDKRKFENFGIVIEESNNPTGSRTTIPGSAGYYFCIDPIDATTNYLSEDPKKKPRFTICFSLIDRKTHQPVVGIVYRPLNINQKTGESGTRLYSAIEGEPATLEITHSTKEDSTIKKTHRILQLSHPESVNDLNAVVSSHCSPEIITSLGLASGNIREMKGSSLKLMYQALARADIYPHYTPNPTYQICSWDTAAGGLIVRMSARKGQKIGIYDARGNPIKYELEHPVHEDGFFIFDERFEEPVFRRIPRNLVDRLKESYTNSQ